jgi:ribosome-associated protein
MQFDGAYFNKVQERKSRMHQIKLREDFIKLGQALKAAGLVDSGVVAKEEILDGKVRVNGAVETQRGKKLHDGDTVDYNGEQIQIIK